MDRLRRCLTIALVLGALALCGCERGTAPPVTTDDEAPPAAVEQLEPQAVNVYFADEDVEHLEPESRDVVAGDQRELLAAVVNELLAGPREEGHGRVIPEGTTLNSAKLDGDTATIDLSKHFGEEFQGGSNTASLALYSLVNSLCELDGVSQVRILLDGQPGEEFGGVYDLAESFEARPELSGGEKL